MRVQGQAVPSAYRARGAGVPISSGARSRSAPGMRGTRGPAPHHSNAGSGRGALHLETAPVAHRRTRRYGYDAMSDVSVWIGDVPLAIREAVEADAGNRNTSVTNVIVGVLAERYGVEWKPSGYPSTSTSGEATTWVVRMPTALREVLRSHAKSVKGTITGCVLLALSQHYGLPAESPRKRRPRRLPHGRARGRKGASA